MKIAYVLLHMRQLFLSGGIGRKIRAQVRFWREAGHEVRIFVLSPDIPPSPEFEVYAFQNAPLLRREWTRSRALAAMMPNLQSYQPDILYLRYAPFVLPLQRIFRIAPVALEINTDDINEYRHVSPFRYWHNRLLRGLLLANSAGIVATSHEIARLPCNQRYHKPTCVISNGIVLEDYPPHPAPANIPPILMFAGTPGIAWHGVDKLLQLGELCPDLHIEIIGTRPDQIQRPIPPNVQLHGLVPLHQVREILQRADVACSTLAFHRNRMEEGSPLKTREYLALGIPTIIAYQDTDLQELSLDTILYLPNTEDNVLAHADRIRNFAYAMRGKRIERSLIAQRIDQRQKELQRLAFFQSLLDHPESPKNQNKKL